MANTPQSFVDVLQKGGRSRAEVWEKGAPAIALAAARRALEAWQQGSARDITHVVVHSCTGFSAPGLDYHLITELGLKSSTRKIPVHFAGCFGGFTGLYVAKQVVEADPTGRSVALVCCAETCTAHMSNDSRPELVIGNTVFADGAGAAIVTPAGFVGHKQKRKDVTADGSAAPAPVLGGDDWQWAIGTMASEILPNSAETMTWKNSAEPGRFDMWLDKSIPRILSTVFVSQGFSLLRRAGISNPFTCAWAIHPGGAAILKAFRKAFDTMHIAGDGLDDSAEVLRANGNMSSATIFFCLQRILASTSRSEIFTAGFGPGLTVEYGRLYRIKPGGKKGDKAASSAAAGEQQVDGDDAHSDDDSSSGGSVDSVPSSVAAGTPPNGAQE